MGEQLFRERMGFMVLCLIGFYCMINTMIMLKTILEPLLWAMFLVMGLMPAVDKVEYWLLKYLFCGDEEVMTTCIGPPLEATIYGDRDLDEELQVLADIEYNGSESTSNREEFAMIRCDQSETELCGEAHIPEPAMKKTMARMLAVFLIIMLLFLAFVAFGLIILNSARKMKDNWEIYKKGAELWASDAQVSFGKVFQHVPTKMIQDISRDLLKGFQDFVYSWIADILNNVSHAMVEGMLTLLYMLFWLCTPMPMRDHVDQLFRRYILLKTVVCLGYGICVGLLLYLLSIDLAAVFGLITFVFNYVPEVGPFVAMAVPCPIILLDSRLERPVVTFFTAVGGQMALKFLFGNLVEVKLIESDVKMRMHPVMILLSVAFFGYLWGATGMLLSVPLMALAKIAVLSHRVPASYRDPILVLLEGDLNAPFRHRRHISTVARKVSSSVRAPMSKKL